MREWIDEYQWLLWVLGVVSLILFLSSLFIAPAVLVRIPADYFAHEHRPPSRWTSQHPAIRLAIAVFRNLIAFVLLVAGITMLITPGQGLLTIFVSFLVADFPKKYSIEKRLILQRYILRTINWIRRRRGKDELIVPASPASS